MSGNTFGTLFTVTTFGESHGPALGAIVDGCPPGLDLAEEDLQADLELRRTGTSRYTSQRREPDRARILSGVFEGRTTGTPIALLVENTDARSRDYEAIRDRFRPGHADYTYQQKYGLRDYRGGGRSSSRITVATVAAGAIARKYLRQRLGVEVAGYVSRIGPHELDCVDLPAARTNPLFCPDPGRLPELERYLDQLRRDGDSIGARVTAIGRRVPPGLGEPMFDRLDADIAFAMMGINAARAIEIGDGVAVAGQRGSEHRDELSPDGFLSNHSGGTLGGISTGQDLIVHVAFKPASSIRIPGRTIDVTGAPTTIVTTGRHDPCVGLRAVPIVEAMLLLVLMDHWLRHRAQCGDVVSATPDITRRR
ncbi:MAG: chorismate synthase [Gammaproteobacteria bacterium]|nr:MAG: chorismate synthase [Gammaproteobacteria bacterium]